MKSSDARAGIDIHPVRCGADECPWGNYPRGRFEPRATHKEIMDFVKKVRETMDAPDYKPLVFR